MLWFIDGSRRSGGVGIREISLQFEVHAIELCLRENLSRKLISEIIYILLDGQTTLKTLHACIYQCLSLSGIVYFVWRTWLVRMW